MNNLKMINISVCACETKEVLGVFPIAESIKIDTGFLFCTERKKITNAAPTVTQVREAIMQAFHDPDATIVHAFMRGASEPTNV